MGHIFARTTEQVRMVILTITTGDPTKYLERYYNKSRSYTSSSTSRIELDPTYEPNLTYNETIQSLGNPQEQLKGKAAYKVIRVLDGDNVVINLAGKETNIRLIGVDTPELGAPYSNEAKQFLTNLLIGEEVYLEYGDELKDKYRRTLAYVYRFLLRKPSNEVMNHVLFVSRRNSFKERTSRISANVI